MNRLSRRSLIAVPALAFANTKPKLLLPSDQPDEYGFRLMWYNPVPPIDQAKWRLDIKGLVEKPRQITLAELRSLPQTQQSSRMKCVQCWSARAT